MIAGHMYPGACVLGHMWHACILVPIAGLVGGHIAGRVAILQQVKWLSFYDCHLHMTCQWWDAGVHGAGSADSKTQACMVRVLKTRKEILHSALVCEVPPSSRGFPLPKNLPLSPLPWWV